MTLATQLLTALFEAGPPAKQTLDKNISQDDASKKLLQLARAHYPGTAASLVVKADAKQMWVVKKDRPNDRTYAVLDLDTFEMQVLDEGMLDCKLQKSSAGKFFVSAGDKLLDQNGHWIPASALVHSDDYKGIYFPSKDDAVNNANKHKVKISESDDMVATYEKIKSWDAKALAGYARKVGIDNEAVDAVKGKTDVLIDEIMCHLHSDDWVNKLKKLGKM